MKIFLAGATGVIGRRLIPLLRQGGHAVIGTTRSAEKAAQISALDATPVVVDVFDADVLTRAVVASKPDAIIHQLTDLQATPGTPGFAAALEANAKLRIEGTRNLVAAAQGANVKHLIAQSIAFVYAPAAGTRVESDPLDIDGARKPMIEGVVALEHATLSLPEGIVLRYGYLYGPDTWYAADKRVAPALHVDAAAQAALLALTHGKPGIYNIAEDDGAVSSENAKRVLGFDAAFRIEPSP